MKTVLKICTLSLLIFISCDPVNDKHGEYPDGKGMFLLNEGNFMAGNGSLSFYSCETREIYNDLFTTCNNRPLGDIPTFFAEKDGTGYIVVNNSGTIEAVDIKSLESLGTLTGLSSPRQMVIRDNVAYVSSLSSTSVTMIDLDDFVVTGSIDIGCNSEALTVSGNRLFAANWAGGSKIVVVDLTDNTVETTISTGMEPESMVIDRNNKLWVLCTGGYLNEETPRIMRINASTLEVEKEMPFRTNTDNPSSLAINARRDTLYYIDEGVRRMTISDEALSSEVLILPEGRLFYKLAIAPWNGLICVTDAIDYQQKGELLIFSKTGDLVDKEETGIIPGFIRFKE